MRDPLRSAAVVAAILTAAVAAPGARAEEKKLGWADTAEFSYVATSGNSESQTLGFKNVLTRTWERSLFKLRAGGIRVETTSINRMAFATDPNFITSDNVKVVEDKETSTTAENYYLDGRYDRQITDRFFWYGGLGWDRNRFAGIENRYVAVGGVGNIWVDREELKFRTDYAMTYTDQEDVVTTPGVDDTFLGFRFSWDYLHKFGASTTYTNVLVVDENLDETSDWRADMINSVSVSMSDRLALKVSLQWLYDNEPSYEEVLVVSDILGNPVTQTPVQVELDELDTIFTASLVVSF